MAGRRRVTQQDIARMTGVSQATVSVVLNGRSDAEVKIAPETRERVLRAIAETGYVADPVARRLGARHNKIIGVFTYEPVFPSANSDFYHPFLVGIEQQAESLGCDLLLLTSSPVVDGRRRIFHQENRIRLADGCILLGRSLDRDELTRLVADGLPFVSIGRRDDAGGPVPYVGAAYGPAVAQLVKRAVKHGHQRLAYFGQGSGPESWTDRFAGFTSACTASGVSGIHLPPATFTTLPSTHASATHFPPAAVTALPSTRASAAAAQPAAAASALAAAVQDRRNFPEDAQILGAKAASSPKMRRSSAGASSAAGGGRAASGSGAGAASGGARSGHGTAGVGRAGSAATGGGAVVGVASGASAAAIRRAEASAAGRASEMAEVLGGGGAGSGAVDFDRVLEVIVAQGVTAVLAEEHADGVALYLAALQRGIELSVATLGEPTRDAPASDVEFSGLRIPRQEMGSQAVEVLTALIEGTPANSQRLLPCDVVTGETLKARK